MMIKLLKDSLLKRNQRQLDFCKFFCTSPSKEELQKKRQEELMKRGLPKKKPIPGVKNVILVSSGKGGVGKSTVAVNLSLAISNLPQSPKVCLLDADIFGPSIPIMMNINDIKPLVDDNDRMLPVYNYGVGCMSMGSLVQSDSAVVWRGPMVMSALNKLLFGTAWGDTDYLVVDTPPGTGDIHLSLSQTVAVGGAVVVTTPQRVARADVRKGVDMYNKMDVPILGLVQNMAAYTCTNCGHNNYVFGQDGARKMAESLDIAILGDIPLDPDIVTSGDSGQPIVMSHPQSQAALVYQQIAEKIVSQVK